MHYSPSVNSFYPSQLRQDYVKAGTWPSDAIEVTDTEYQEYGQCNPPAGMERGPDGSGRPSWVPIPPPDLETLATHKRSEVDNARDAALQAGMPYAMPDGTQETVQTRPQDEPNLLALAIEARDLKADGVDDPQLVLRVESNRNYQLTPQQMIDLTDAAKNHKKLILAKSWQLKDAVDAALAAEDREAIEAIKWV